MATASASMNKLLLHEKCGSGRQALLLQILYNETAVSFGLAFMRSKNLLKAILAQVAHICELRQKLLEALLIIVQSQESQLKAIRQPSCWNLLSLLLSDSC